jgi:hypothetical protein
MPRLAWFALLAVACGQPASATQAPRGPESRAGTVDAAADGAPALADDLPRLALRARDLYADWAAAFADGAIDCATATARLDALATKHAEVAAANRAVFQAGHARVKALRAELEKYDAEMAPNAKAIIESPIMSRCAGERPFAAAVDRMQGDR